MDMKWKALVMDGEKLVSQRLWLFLAVLICSAALICSSAFAVERQRRLEVLPIIFVPSDNKDIPEKDFPDYMLQIYRQLVLAQRHWLNVLQTDTFAISPFGEVYHAKHPHTYYAEASSSFNRQLIEVFELKKDNRIDSTFSYLIVYVRPKASAKIGPWMGGARTFNGKPNTGGGGIQMEFTAPLFDESGRFQSTLVHELGHTFGLSHPDCRGYSLTENPSMMSYNPKHWSHGLVEGPEYAGLNPEEFFVIGQNKLAFPNFRYVEAIHNPTHKRLANIENCYLGPMDAAIGGDPERKLHNFGYELFFNGKLVSGPEAPFMSHDDAVANCKGNIENHRGQISVECRWYGKRFTP
jgi:hypothetical protein